MKFAIAALVLSPLVAAARADQPPKVTSLLTRHLVESEARDVEVITHVVCRNASETEPAKFLAFLVKPEGAPTFMPVE